MSSGFGHVLISGMSLSGKSTLAKQMASAYAARGYGVIVYDPFLSRDWGQKAKTDKVRVTGDYESFIWTCKNATQCALFIDEAPEICSRQKEFRESAWLSTQARHWGHRSHFIAQSPMEINSVIRANCTMRYTFRLLKAEAIKLHKQTGEEIHLSASELPPGVCISDRPFQSPKLLRVF